MGKKPSKRTAKVSHSTAKGRILVDVQLLMRNGEYRHVAALTPLLKRYPTPEFAQLVTAAHQIVSAEITGAILGKSPNG